MVLIGSMKVASSNVTLSGSATMPAPRPRHGFDVFGEAAAVGGEAGGEAGGLVLLALGEEAAFAVETFAAGNVVKTHHAVAQFPFADAAADGDDGAGEFMAEDLWRGDVGVVDFFDIGAADTAGGDLDKGFAVSDFRNRDIFDADDSFFAVDAGTHGFGDRAQRARGFERCASPAHLAATSPNADAAIFPWSRPSEGMKSSRKSARFEIALRLR